jgi:hypothetical protein
MAIDVAVSIHMEGGFQEPISRSSRSLPDAGPSKRFLCGEWADDAREEVGERDYHVVLN